MRALHAAEPFAWRPTERPMESPFARARRPAEGTREEARALLDAVGDVDASARAAFDACRCAAEASSRPAPEAALAEARRAAERPGLFAETGVRALRRLDARVQAYQAAESVRTAPERAARALDRGWHALSTAEAITDPPP